MLWSLFSHIYDEVLRRYPPYQKLILRVMGIIEERQSFKTGPLLDAGCGTGNFAVEIGKRKIEVLAIDRSDSMLRIAENKIKQEALNTLNNVVFCKADLNEPLNIANKSFQSVLCIHSLYLLEKPQKSLHEFSRILKDGGYLIICNPCRPLSAKEIYDAGKEIFSEGMKSRNLWQAQKFIYILIGAAGINFIIQMRKNEEIFHCWTRPDIQALLEEAHFKVETISESCINRSHLMVIARKR
jgi:ubiquinone/menaquinone biosynthesis C-methylase UbiE